MEPPNFSFPDIRAFFTERILGDNADKVKVVSKEANISTDMIYLPIQKHTNRIHILETDLESAVADAVVTARRHIMIGVLVADCVPILLYDSRRKIIGAVHAGWRGTAQHILKNAVHIMQNRFNSSSADISIAIGPSIRECCYEVGEEVMASVREATGEGAYYHKMGETYFIDIASANRMQALAMDVPEKNIWKAGECTHCCPERFYSYRYSGDYAGRQGGFIMMW